MIVLKSIRKPVFLFCCFLLLGEIYLPVHAATSSSETTSSQEQDSSTYTNPDTGYIAYILDTQDLLTDSEEASLLEDMEPITAYGNVAFESVYVTSGTTESYAASNYRSLFGSDSGTILYIDMGNRNLWIQSNGNIYQTITKSYANTITDNIYSYASKEDYYQCASEAFQEINALLAGQKIAQPMKYISNGLLALIIAFLLNYLLVIAVSHAWKPSRSEMIGATNYKCNILDPEVHFSHQTRVYSPPSKSGGGSHGGGHGGGGGHSGGGGGGHSF